MSLMIEWEVEPCEDFASLPPDLRVVYVARNASRPHAKVEFTPGRGWNWEGCGYSSCCLWPDGGWWRTPDEARADVEHVLYRDDQDSMIVHAAIDAHVHGIPGNELAALHVGLVDPLLCAHKEECPGEWKIHDAVIAIRCRGTVGDWLHDLVSIVNRFDFPGLSRKAQKASLAVLELAQLFWTGDFWHFGAYLDHVAAFRACETGRAQWQKEIDILSGLAISIGVPVPPSIFARPAEPNDLVLLGIDGGGSVEARVIRLEGEAAHLFWFDSHDHCVTAERGSPGEPGRWWRHGTPLVPLS